MSLARPDQGGAELVVREPLGPLPHPRPKPLRQLRSPGPNTRTRSRRRSLLAPRIGRAESVSRPVPLPQRRDLPLSAPLSRPCRSRAPWLQVPAPPHCHGPPAAPIGRRWPWTELAETALTLTIRRSCRVLWTT